MTRISFAMARNILRRFSACISRRSAFLSFGFLILSVRCRCCSLVTPSTRRRTSSPNSSRICSSVITVSSSTSCNRPAAMVSLSSSSSARMIATQSGWIIYASPDLRTCPLCASKATWYAFSINVISVEGWYFRILAISSSYKSSGLENSWIGLMLSEPEWYSRSIRSSSSVEISAMRSPTFSICHNIIDYYNL